MASIYPIMLSLICCVLAQDPKAVDNNPEKFPWDQYKYNRDDRDNRNKPISSRNTYFMDSPVDCSQKTFVIGTTESVVVKGRGSVQTGPGLTSCTLTLEIDAARENKKFRIGVRSVDIVDCNVNFNVYDGRLGETILDSYVCKREQSGLDKESVLYTSGNIVTFHLKRKTRESSNYDIELDLQTFGAGGPVDCDRPPCDPTNPYIPSKLEQKYIVLIIGLCYLLLTVVIITIITYCCVVNAKSGGHWEQRGFGYNNPALNNSGGTTASGKVVSSGGAGSNVWVTPKPYGKEQMPVRGNPPMITKRVPVVTKRFVANNEDADSVFESDAELMDTRPRRRDNQPRRNEPRQKRHEDRSDDERDDRPRNDTGKQRNIEREVAIPDKRKSKPKNRRRDDFSSDEYTSESEHSSDEENVESEGETQHTDVDDDHKSPDKKERRDMGTGPTPKRNAQPRPQPAQVDHGTDDHDDPDDDPDDDQEQVPPSYQETTQHDDDPDPRNIDPRQPPDTRNDPGDDQTDRAYPDDPRRGYDPRRPQNDPRYPVNQTQTPPQQYHPHDPRYRPNYRPPYQQQPQQSPQSTRRDLDPYQHSPASYRRDQPYQHSPASYRPDPPRPNHPRDNPDRQPYDPRQPENLGTPSYSYLVRRGYAPDGRSPESSAAGSHQDYRLDESTDYSANLDSGVELMKRTTEV